MLLAGGKSSGPRLSSSCCWGHLERLVKVQVPGLPQTSQSRPRDTQAHVAALRGVGAWCRSHPPPARPPQPLPPFPLSSSFPPPSLTLTLHPFLPFPLLPPSRGQAGRQMQTVALKRGHREALQGNNRLTALLQRAPGPRTLPSAVSPSNVQSGRASRACFRRL